MKHSTLGDTDLAVSRLCLGTMTFGEQNSEAEAHAQLDYALEQGIDFIDTAEMYPVPPRAETQGLTESYIGTWLARRGGRERLVLASKIAGPGVDYLRGGSRLEPGQIERALDDSLMRLKTDYLDLYQVHWPPRRANYFGKRGYAATGTPDDAGLEETLEGLARVVEAGKVRHIGLSNETPWGSMRYLELAARHEWPRLVSIQNPYNLLNRTYEVGLAEVSHRERCGLLAYSPLGFGVLTGKYLDGARPTGARLTLFERFARYTNPQAAQATARYVELAREAGLAPAQMALAFVNSRPFVTSTIIGATTVQQLEENVDSIDVDLPEDLLERIDAIHQAQPNPCP